MSNLTSSLTIKVVDDTARMAAIGNSVDRFKNRLKALEGQVKKIDAFQTLKKQYQDAQANFKAAQQTVTNYQRSIAQVGKPTKEMAAGFKAAQKEVDRASKALDKTKAAALSARRELVAAGLSLGDLGGAQQRLKSRIDGVTSAIAAQAAQMKRHRNAATQASTASREAFDPKDRRTERMGNARRTLMGAGLATTYAAGQGVRSAYQRAKDFEFQGNLLEARAEYTRQERREIEAHAIKIANKYKFDVVEPMKAAVVMAQAGAKPAAAKAGMEAGLVFGRFGDLPTTEATEGLVSIATAYGMAVETEADARKTYMTIADVIAKAANISKANPQEVIKGVTNFAGLAKQLGVPLNLATAAVAAGVQAGEDGSKMGTAMRNSLVRMVAPTTPGIQAMAQRGLRMSDYVTMKPLEADPMMRSLQARGVKVRNEKKLSKSVQQFVSQPVTGDSIEALVTAISGPKNRKNVQERGKVQKAIESYVQSQAESVNFLKLLDDLDKKGATAGEIAKIFQGQHVSRLLPLIKNPEFRQYLKELDGAGGAAERGALKMNQGLPGAENELTNAYSQLIRTIADAGVAKAAADAMVSLAGAIKSLSEMSPETVKYLTYTGLALAALAPMAIAIKGISAVGMGAAAALGATYDIMSKINGAPKGAPTPGSPGVTSPGGGNVGEPGGKPGAHPSSSPNRTFNPNKPSLGSRFGELAGKAWRVAKIGMSAAQFPLWIREFGELMHPMNPQSYPYRVGHAIDSTTWERAKRDQDERRRDPEAARGRAFNRITSQPQVDTNAIDNLEKKAESTAINAKTALSFTATPTVDSSSLDSALAKANQLRATLAGISSSLSSLTASVGAAHGNLSMTNT